MTVKSKKKEDVSKRTHPPLRYCWVIINYFALVGKVKTLIPCELDM